MDMKTFEQKIMAIADKNQGAPLPQTIAGRIKKELQMIHAMHYEQELALVGAIVRDCRLAGYWPLHRTPIGSSYVAYLLGIVKEDPLKHNLYPEMLFSLEQKERTLCALSVPTAWEKHFCATVQKLCEERSYTVITEDEQFLVCAPERSFYIEFLTYDEEMNWTQRNVFPKTREDLYALLLDSGMERKTAFRITEYVRKGKAFARGLPEEYVAPVRDAGLPQELIDKLQEIQYLPSAAVLLQQRTIATKNQEDNMESQEHVMAEIPTEEQRLYWYIPLGIAGLDADRRYNSRQEAKAAVDKILSRIYRSAEKLFMPGENSLAAEYGNKYAIRIFDKYFPDPDTEEELPEPFGTLLKNTAHYLDRELNKELLESADYYRLYEKSYFLDLVSIEEHDYTVDTGDGGLFDVLFRLISPDKDYTVENLIETVIELEEDVNRRADTFSKAAFAAYQRYCNMLDKAKREA